MVPLYNIDDGSEEGIDVWEGLYQGPKGGCYLHYVALKRPDNEPMAVYGYWNTFCEEDAVKM